MTLARYNTKRNFMKTHEPKGLKTHHRGALQFVIQKHDASHLHYDLRLEMNGVMKSWAVPKGPSLDPDVKRIAMQVEDHPISYNRFEGHIPPLDYGAGDVIVWDKGKYRSLETKNPREGEEELLEGLAKGRLSFFLEGKKLRGAYSLYRFKEEKEWILQKQEDEFARLEDITADPRSVISKKMLIGRNEDTEKFKNLITHEE